LKILVDENIPQGREVFSVYGEVKTFHGRKVTAEDVKDADALLVRSITKVNAALLDGSRVKFVGTATIGVDHVDQAYLNSQGIGFSAAPGCNARSVAEYFVAALLHLHVRHGLAYEGKTLGVVGYGNVGKAVAAIAPALGLKVIVSDPPLADAGLLENSLPLAELCERADIITCHAPLTRSGPHPTLGMVNAGVFAKWKRPKALLNMGRGEVIDALSLLVARAAGKVSHLVLDVFPNEPHADAELIRQCDLASPHIAGYSIRGKLNGTTQIHDAFLAHFGLQKKAEVAYPVPENPMIAAEPANSPVADNGTPLHSIVRQVYEIARDDAELRSGIGSENFGAHFDALRKNYPVRHEFASFRVTGADGSLRDSLARLGFVI
jgi:erythronate-4-phosphate dehydrogenase